LPPVAVRKQLSAVHPENMSKINEIIEAEAPLPGFPVAHRRLCAAQAHSQLALRPSACFAMRTDALTDTSRVSAQHASRSRASAMPYPHVHMTDRYGDLVPPCSSLEPAAVAGREGEHHLGYQNHGDPPGRWHRPRAHHPPVVDQPGHWGCGTNGRREIVKWIEEDNGKAYVDDGDGDRDRADVGIVTPSRGEKYLRIHADGIWTDNLLALPRK
jgi:Protein of unknown function (DUF3892)